MIKKTNTVEQTELIKLFSEEFEIDWNDACDEIGDIDFKGPHDIYNVDFMIDDEYNIRAWTFLKDFMVSHNINKITVI